MSRELLSSRMGVREVGVGAPEEWHQAARGHAAAVADGEGLAVVSVEEAQLSADIQRSAVKAERHRRESAVTDQGVDHRGRGRVAAALHEPVAHDYLAGNVRAAGFFSRV